MATKKTTEKPALPAAEPNGQKIIESILPIIGIGASAGGLEAFEAFFGTCPADTGMAFVLVPHLDPTHQSLLCDILQRVTIMPVVEASDQLAVSANRVYVIPPNREMTIFKGVLQLSVPEQTHGQRMPIDGFLRSLAEDRAEQAVGIILSGTATDGTLGLRAIYGVGGVCIVQDPASAKYDGMPQSAIAAGYVTHILAVEKMPAFLLTLKRHTVFHHSMPPLATEKVLNGIKQILLQVRSVTGHDFSLYKKSTIGRRIERRMSLHGIEDTAVYFRYLKENPSEVHLLFKELLINVTSFFRDPEAFNTLKQNILPALLTEKPAGYVYRVWVAGCASGEEAYSIAIVLQEVLDELREKHTLDITIQIYATDLDDDAIAVARAGKYPLNIAQDVTPERLRRFFSKDDAGYKVKKEIREMLVFAVQNVIKDPPFTKLDLLSCRNLMIYLEPELQSRLIPTFHYALKTDGVLLLSSSESIANHAELFFALDRKWKFYRAKQTSGIIQREMSNSAFRMAEIVSKTGGVAVMPNKPKNINVVELSNRALLQAFAPASVTTDVNGNILYVHGDTGRYLRPAPGPISTNIVEMAREGLPLELRSALINAATSATPTLSREVSVKTNGGFSMVSLSVRRLPNSQADDNLLLVSFQDIAAHHSPATAKEVQRKRGGVAVEAGRAELLQRELAFAKENLQATIEEQQATNEELKSTNEELQSTNEELQSANEELETSKEELQSLNEEMITVNAEQNDRIEQLNNLQNDMKNLLDSTNIGTLFLDHQLCIRRYTREAVKAYRLVSTDVGRPLSDIKSNLNDVDLLAELQIVLDTLIPREREVSSISGAHYLARMQPYRTLDNVIEGAVLTFTDITESNEAGRLKLASLQMAHQLAEGIVKTISEPLLVLDDALRVVSASAAFYKHFQLMEEKTIGCKIYALGNPDCSAWNTPVLHHLLENSLQLEEAINGYEVDHEIPDVGVSRLVLNARRINALGHAELIVLAIVSIAPVTPVTR